ncbi:COX15/CtaA family protein [Methylophilaceae bacterium]|jgi:heme a synthase|nr:COX15/CtaA family protein [Methylophilaceae bacterium]
MVWFQRLILFATFLTLCVVVFGAYVRLTDAGLGCPDWPGCFGTLTVPESEVAIIEAQSLYPESIVEVGKAWREMIHRYLAGILGLLILLISFVSYKIRHDLKVKIILPFFILALVMFQATLGMWTVTMLLKPAIVTAHLMGGMTILALLTYLTHRHLGAVSNTIIINPGIKSYIRFGFVLLFIQILLGGWTSTNYAALACTDFPTCHGSLMPDMDFKNGFSPFRELGMTSSGEGLSIEALQAIQWVHRVGALILTIYFIFMAFLLRNYPSTRFYRNLLLLVLLFQVIIGIANLIMYLPLLLATLHNLGAALLVIITTIINSRITPQYDKNYTY